MAQSDMPEFMPLSCLAANTLPDVEVKLASDRPLTLAPALGDGQVLTHAIRQARMCYQKGLLMLLRSATPAIGLAHMQQALRELGALASAAKHKDIWSQAMVLLEALGQEAVLLDTEVKRLCSRIDLLIRRWLIGADELAESLACDIRHALGQYKQVNAQSLQASGFADTVTSDPLPSEPLPEKGHEPLASDALCRLLVEAEAHWLAVCCGQQDRIVLFKDDVKDLGQAAGECVNLPLKAVLQLIEEASRFLTSISDIAQNEALQLEMMTAIMLARNACTPTLALDKDFDELIEELRSRLAAALNQHEDRLFVPRRQPLLDELAQQAQRKLAIVQIADEIEANLKLVESRLDRLLHDDRERNGLLTACGAMAQIVGALNLLQRDTPAALARSALALLHRLTDANHMTKPETIGWLKDVVTSLRQYLLALRVGQNDEQPLAQLLSQVPCKGDDPAIVTAWAQEVALSGLSDTLSHCPCENSAIPSDPQAAEFLASVDERSVGTATADARPRAGEVNKERIPLLCDQRAGLWETHSYFAPMSAQDALVTGIVADAQIHQGHAQSAAARSTIQADNATAHAALASCKPVFVPMMEAQRLDQSPCDRSDCDPHASTSDALEPSDTGISEELCLTQKKAGGCPSLPVRALVLPLADDPISDSAVPGVTLNNAGLPDALAPSTRQVADAEASEANRGTKHEQQEAHDVPGKKVPAIATATQSSRLWSLPTVEALTGIPPVTELVPRGGENTTDRLDNLLEHAADIGLSRSRARHLLAYANQMALELKDNFSRLRFQLDELVRLIPPSAEPSQSSALEHRDDLGHYGDHRLQEFIRLLKESVEDASTAHDDLLTHLNAADRALVMQSCLTRHLQHELMRLSLMPFARLSQRLSYVVQQVARDYGRQAKLAIEGGQIEMDRTVLARLAGPLEHLLQHALVQRLRSRRMQVVAEKPESDITIRMSLRQEGKEIIIELADEAAFDLEANGANAETSSWNAPALDEVRDQIARLGGWVQMESQAGCGLRFTLRLPQTLGVTSVVLACAGGQTYALPAHLVVLVRQASQEELANLQRTGAVELGGVQYPLRSLAELTHSQFVPASRRNGTLLLLGSGTKRLALHVDAIEGNDEVVLKNVGPQVAHIPGIVGATVLGDGRIAVILNPFALAERAPRTQAWAESAEAASEQAPLIMVVDDSLTMRKITSRLLQRAGYRVITAKDGVEALELLQDEMPAVMLLDIEMPNLDGYEVVRAVRANSRLSHLPIIMITSRTADKHRQYALKLGVNHYMGKPFDEEELLAAIARFTGEVVAAH